MKNRLIWAILGLLGFSACDNENENMVMYGTPTVDITVKGRVTDAQGKAIPGIAVTTPFSGDVKTGSDGRFVFETQAVQFNAPFTEMILFEDVDGPENGEFASEELSLTFTEDDRTAEGHGSWYNGAFEKDGVEVTLDEVTGEAE